MTCRPWMFNLFLVFPLVLSLDYSFLVDNGNYTRDEIKYWFGTEKHYSSTKKEHLFKILDKHTNCSQLSMPLFLSDIVYSNSKGNGILQSEKYQLCKSVDAMVVIFLSNYSINNNYSHFLHALLRLFCSLIDSGLVIWNQKTNTFRTDIPYTIWLDQYFKLTDNKKLWVESLGYDGHTKTNTKLRKLGSEVSQGECRKAKKLVYGSGCVRLLPPEKWYGFPGCRAFEILPAFGTYFRQLYNISQRKNIIYINNSYTVKGQYNQWSNIYNQDSNDFNIKNKLAVSFAIRSVSHITGSKYAHCPYNI